MGNKGWHWALSIALGLSLGLAAYWFAKAPARHEALPVTPKLKSRLALIIDDWGYNTRLLAELKAFPGKLTVAVIPGLPHSQDCAQAAHDSDKEVIMHLPVEPLGNIPLAQGTLMVGMGEAKVFELCDHHALSVPYMVGLNNHEGSKGSADPALMAAVAKWLKSHGRGLFFLDSVTTLDSVIPAQAHLAGVPFARRDIFLDNVDEKEAIEKMAQKALQHALKGGICIAIGHPRPNTLKVLAQLVDVAKAQGVELVYVSSLVGPDGAR